jgi:hypothetical protein
VLPEHPALEYDWDKMILSYQTVLEVVSVKRVPFNETQMKRSKRETKGKLKPRPYDLEISLKQVATPPAGVPDATPKKKYIVAFLDVSFSYLYITFYFLLGLKLNARHTK